MAKRISIPANIYGHGRLSPCTLSASVRGSSPYWHYSEFAIEDGDASLPDGEYIVSFEMIAVTFCKSGTDWEWVRRQA